MGRTVSPTTSKVWSPGATANRCLQFTSSRQRLHKYYCRMSLTNLEYKRVSALALFLNYRDPRGQATSLNRISDAGMADTPKPCFVRYRPTLITLAVNFLYFASYIADCPPQKPGTSIKEITRVKADWGEKGKGYE